uniref:Uncharacterized protein n=1 Tax=Arundo donax TaxID=35708 RepID=A0A0A8ZTR8_ARUDO
MAKIFCWAITVFLMFSMPNGIIRTSKVKLHVSLKNEWSQHKKTMYYSPNIRFHIHERNLMHKDVNVTNFQ